MIKAVSTNNKCSFDNDFTIINSKLGYMKYLIVVLFLFCINTSCKKENTGSLNLNVQKSGPLTIIDSLLLVDTISFHYNKVPGAEYRIFYLGIQSAEVNLEQKGINSYWTEETSYRAVKNLIGNDITKLNAVVDTTMTLASLCTIRKNDQDTSSVPILVKSYPIIIRNNSDSTFHLGLSNNLNAIKQTKTLNGEWVDMELPMLYCGTGIREVFLKGHEMLVAKFVQGSGDIKIETRLRVEIAQNKYVFSNTFIDNIDSVSIKNLTYDDMEWWSTEYNHNVLYIK